RRIRASEWEEESLSPGGDNAPFGASPLPRLVAKCWRILSNRGVLTHTNTTNKKATARVAFLLDGALGGMNRYRSGAITPPSGLRRFRGSLQNATHFVEPVRTNRTRVPN